MNAVLCVAVVQVSIIGVTIHIKGSYFEGLKGPDEMIEHSKNELCCTQ